jgi:chromosome segregation ATPase
MKVILIILVLALGGLAYKFQIDGKSAKAKMIAAEAELVDANAKITALEAKVVASAEAKVASAEAKVVAAVEAKLDELKKIYDRNLFEITDLRARLDANYSRVSSAIDTLRYNPPTFSEHTQRYTGKAGIRTSAADREEAMAKHKSELDGLAAQLAAIEEEQIKLRAREQALDDAYVQARAKVVEE